MANYHFSMKPISRSDGRSATAAAAYRSGKLVIDERTGEVHDYRYKQGIVSSDLMFPEGCELMESPNFWNAVEQKHKRGDAVLAREFEISLPDELSASERKRLACDFAKEVADFYNVGAEVSIHLPSKKGDHRNHHFHLMMSACSVTPAGLGNKVAELDPIHCKRHKIASPADYWRKRWADLTNERLEENGIDARIDHRSLKEQGIDRPPQAHIGPAATGFERRTGEVSDIRIREREKAAALAAEKAEEERQQQMTDLLHRLNAAEVQLSIHHTSAKDDLTRAEMLAEIEAREAAAPAASEPAPDPEDGSKPP